MPREIVCPSCGNRGVGTTNDTGAFDVRGQLEGKAIRKCRKCGAGLAFGLFSGWFLGKPKVIPKDLWQRMQKLWNEEFGEK